MGGLWSLEHLEPSLGVLYTEGRLPLVTENMMIEWVTTKRQRSSLILKMPSSQIPHPTLHQTHVLHRSKVSAHHLPCNVCPINSGGEKRGPSYLCVPPGACYRPPRTPAPVPHWTAAPRPCLRTPRSVPTWATQALFAAALTTATQTRVIPLLPWTSPCPLIWGQAVLTISSLCASTLGKEQNDLVFSLFLEDLRAASLGQDQRKVNSVTLSRRWQCWDTYQTGPGPGLLASDLF